MDILFDVRPLQEPNPGGITRVTECLLPELIKLYPQNTLLTSGVKKNKISDKSKSNNQHLKLPNNLLAGLFAFNLTSLDRLTKKHDHLFLFNLGFVGKPTIPYSLLVHDLSFLVEPRWFKWKSRLWHRCIHTKQLIKNAAHLFAVSETTKQDLINLLKIPPKRITVTHLGPTLHSPLSTLHPSSAAVPEWGRYLLALDAANPRKNSQVIIDAFSLLKKNPLFHDIKLVLTGSSPKKISSPDIILLRRPNHQTIAVLMQHANIFLYPSWYEGFGLPLHEAAHFHTPCIASTTSCLPETAPKQTIFVPPTRPALWMNAMEELLLHPTQHHTSSTLPSWESIAKKIHSVLKN